MAKLTKIQFVIRMAVEIGNENGIKAHAAIPIAVDLFRECLADQGIAFGDPRFAWDDDAAKIIVKEYGNP